MSFSPSNSSSPLELVGLIPDWVDDWSPFQIHLPQLRCSCFVSPSLWFGWPYPGYSKTFIWFPDPHLNLIVLHNFGSFSFMWVRSDYLCLGIGLFCNLREEFYYYWGMWWSLSQHPQQFARFLIQSFISCIPRQSSSSDRSSLFPGSV